MQNIWAIRTDDIAAAQKMPNAKEMGFSDDPSEMTVGYRIGLNLPTRIHWQLERIQNQMEGRDHFYMNQGIEWGLDAVPYSMWDENTVRAHREYAGKAVTYRTNKQMAKGKGKGKVPEPEGIKDYTKKQVEKGPPSTNSYTQSDELPKRVSPEQTPTNGGKLSPEPPRELPGGGPPDRGSGGGGGDPRGDPPGRPGNPDQRDQGRSNPPGGGPPGRGQPGRGPQVEDHLIGDHQVEDDLDRDPSPDRQDNNSRGSHSGHNQTSDRNDKGSTAGPLNVSHPGDEDICFASGVVSMYGDSAEVNQHYHPMSQHGVVWKDYLRQTWERYYALID